MLDRLLDFFANVAIFLKHAVSVDNTRQFQRTLWLLPEHEPLCQNVAAPSRKTSTALKGSTQTRKELV